MRIISSALTARSAHGRFKEEIDDLVDRLTSELPKAFQHDELRREKEGANEKFQERDKKLLGDIEKQAAKNELSIQSTPTGCVMIPLLAPSLEK